MTIYNYFLHCFWWRPHELFLHSHCRNDSSCLRVTKLWTLIKPTWIHDNHESSEQRRISLTPMVVLTISPAHHHNYSIFFVTLETWAHTHLLMHHISYQSSYNLETNSFIFDPQSLIALTYFVSGFQLNIT